MATKVDDKEPDTDNGGGGGGWREVLAVYTTSLGTMQLQVQRIEDDGTPLGLWTILLSPGSKEMRQVMAYIKEHGLRVSDEAIEAMDSQRESVGEQFDRHGLRTGALLPCECCGAATRGMPASENRDVLAELRQPDDAGRIWLVEEEGEDPLIAVCSNPACIDVWLRWEDVCYQEAFVDPRGRP